MEKRMFRVDAWKIARRIVSRMTLDEKISQIDYRASAIPRLDIPEYNWWNEALHGVARAGIATVFPQAIGLAAMFDSDMMERIGAVISTEGRAKYNEAVRHGDRDIYKGLTFWSPNVNIFRDPRWGRGQETYGEDPYLTARLAVAFIRGIQGDGKYLKAAACAKHFAVHSGPEALRHEFDARVSQKDLHETYLSAFKAAVKEAQVEIVMGAYNRVNGVPACASHELLSDILRSEWGFEGHVVSDYEALEDIFKHHHYVADEAHTMAVALKAGCNLCAGKIARHLRSSVDEGLISEDEITEAVERLFTTRIMMGMMADDCPYDSIGYEENDTPEHHQLAVEAASRSFVLLKNDGLLPLEMEKISSIAVIGPNANSRKMLEGNYNGTASRYVTVLEGIQDLVGDSVRVWYSEGCHLYKNFHSSLSGRNDRLAEAVSAAQHADVVVLCLGLDATLEGEEGDVEVGFGSGDKPNLSLPGRQQLLLDTMLTVGKPVILLLASGSALTLGGRENDENLKAILQIWYPGAMGGKAVADVLFGRRAPAGKLPVTFYASADELPAFEDYSMAGRTYRYMKGNALYPFGYGLTYSPCSIVSAGISGKTADGGVEITVDIRNDGGRTTEEVVQVYVKDMDSPLAVINHALAGFRRITLAPGEKTSRTIVIEPEAFTVVDEGGRRIPGGRRFLFHVGFSQPDSRSIALCGIKPVELEYLRTD